MCANRYVAAQVGGGRVTLVTLTPYELVIASAAGSMRQVASVKGGHRDAHGYDGSSGWQVHLEGACGELAAAKALGCYWGGSVNTFKRGADVAPGYQVRTTAHQAGHLIVRDDDPGDATFILVVGQAPTYRIAGTILGCHAKRAEWRQAPAGRPPAYFVPQHALVKL